MTTWSIVSTKTNPIAPTYTGAWERIWFDIPTTPQLATDWLARFDSSLPTITNGVVILGEQMSVLPGHELDPNNTILHMDMTFGIDPVLHPASISMTPSAIFAFFIPIIQAISMIAGGLALGAVALNMGRVGSTPVNGGSGGTTTSTGGIGDMMGMIMPIMMLSMLMPMMTNMMPKN